MAKFHKDSITLYGVAQIAEGTSAVRGAVLTDTISVALDGTAVTGGAGALFQTEVTVGDIIYNSQGIKVGKVTAIASEIAMTITAAEVAMTTEAYSIDKNVFAGTITVGTGANTITGVSTAFLTELTPDAYIYDLSGALIGQVDTVTDDTTATLYANGAVIVTAASFSSGLGAKNALAALNMNFSTERTSEAFVYVGDSLSRDEKTVVTDEFAKFDFETFLPRRGAIAGANPTAKEVPLSDWFESAGLGIILSSDSSGTITLTNSIPSNELLTIEVRLTSPDITTSKTYTMSDCRGVTDADMVVGSLAKIKFDYQGNLDTVSQKASLTADFGQQKSTISPTLKSPLISLSRLLVYTSATEPDDVGGTNLCFEKITAPNVAGFEYDRFQTSCEGGWSKGAVPSDVTVTIVEDEAGAIYNPDDNIESDHSLAVRWGAGAGNLMELYFHKLQLANIGNSEVAKYRGQDLSFRNTGTLDIVLK